MSSWFKVDVKTFPCSELTACDRLAIFLCQKPMVYTRSTMVMKGVF